LSLQKNVTLSGGRSGQYVKNLSGPPNSILKGSKRRIYITSAKGEVIWDITAERAKQVIPGKGFLKKTKPTKQQLELLKKAYETN
jgi:predicted oxidoreductase (fatty acid repression mutant protein)